MSNGSGKCHSCGNALSGADYGRQEICPKCRRDTRVCKNCTHYDTAAYNSCRENQADRVVDKDRSNFCDYFRPSEKNAGAEDPAAKAKVAAEALFKKK